MAIGFPAGVTKPYTVQSAQARLAELRAALNNCESIYQWLSAYSAADLEADPLLLDSVSAQDLLNAYADAHAMFSIYDSGILPSGYTPGYKYATSQRVVIAAVV